MDPDYALANIRDCIADARAAFEGDSNDDEHDALVDLVDCFESLDNWLSKGGFLPNAWKVSR